MRGTSGTKRRNHLKLVRMVPGDVFLEKPENDTLKTLKLVGMIFWIPIKFTLWAAWVVLDFLFYFVMGILTMGAIRKNYRD